MTDFLYPFIDGDERDPGPLLADLAASAAAKIGDSRDLTATTMAAHGETIPVAAAAMAARFASGGRAWTFGNGGSSCDALAFASLLSRRDHGPAVPARCLTADPSIVTAIGNDVGYPLVFTRQLIAYGRPGDLAVGFSTSGNSTNLLGAFEQASRQGMLTIGFAGYDGGEMARSPAVEHCFVVASQSVHRIQEAQAALESALWTAVLAALSGAGRPAGSSTDRSSV